MHPGGAEPALLTVFNDTLYFTADDGVHGTELWKTDGTESGTTLIKDITPGAASSFLEPFFVLDSKLYFYTDDILHKLGLWTTDGTPEGTTLVKDFSA